MNTPHRKRYNNNGSNNNNGGSGGGNNYRGRNRQGGSGGSGNGGGYRGGNNSNHAGGTPRPRKNFRAMQEKYLNMAKEALSSGDRILAEYYLQHADHYHRENEEFLVERNKWHEQRAERHKNNPQAQADEAADEENHDEADEGDMSENAEVDLSTSGSALPAFLTRKVAAGQGGAKPVQQDWEE